MESIATRENRERIVKLVTTYDSTTDRAHVEAAVRFFERRIAEVHVEPYAKRDSGFIIYVGIPRYRREIGRGPTWKLAVEDACYSL